MILIGKKFIAQFVIIIILFVIGTPAALADGHSNEKALPLMDFGYDYTLVGVFHPYSDNIKKDEIIILVRNKKWLFQVVSFKELAPKIAGKILHTNRIPCPLRLIGPNTEIKPLIEKDIINKMYFFIGTIYNIDQIMVIKAGEEIPIKK